MTLLARWGTPEWRRRGSRIVDLAADLGAPLLLSGVAIHELLYNGWGWITWLLIAGMVWPLVLRRRMPVVVFAVCGAFAAALLATGIVSFASAALLVALYSVAAHTLFRYAIVCALLLEVGVVLVAAQSTSADDETAFLTGLALASLFLGTTLRSKRQYLASVEDRAARLELDRAQQAQLAAAAERTRIAREMHDIVAHGLSVMITLAEGAAATVGTQPDAARTAMERVASGGRQSLAEMRKLFDVLRAEEAVDRAPQPSLAALDALLDDVRTTGLEVRLATSGSPVALSPAAQATIYRIVQESLTNVMKHAHEATAVRVALDYRPSVVRFAIQDDAGARRRPSGDGASGAWPTSGKGLLGMRERVAIFDGTLDAGPDEAGWLVRGELRVS